MAFQFKNKEGKPVDVLHSYNFMKKKLHERHAIAFDPNVRKKLNKEDQLLMRGYATAIAEINRASAYNYKKQQNVANAASAKAPF